MSAELLASLGGLFFLQLFIIEALWLAFFPGLCLLVAGVCYWKHLWIVIPIRHDVAAQAITRVLIGMGIVYARQDLLITTSLPNGFIRVYKGYIGSFIQITFSPATEKSQLIIQVIKKFLTA